MRPARADDATTFADLALCPELLRALSALGYEEPTPIQREAIPPLLQGRDLLGQAATGTGKTAAFALPVLERIPRHDRRGEPTALVLVPTRELAVQVSEAIHRYGRELGGRVLPLYGGQPIGRQLRALERGVDVVVATPGRALDHIARRTLRLRGLQMVVLDEADEMLDMGFADDIEAILQDVPEDRQTVLFSATMPPRIDGMARRHLHDPVRIQLGRATSPPGEASLVRQRAYVVPRAHKAAALGRVLDVEAPVAALVFCRTRDEVDQLTETLNGRGYRAEALHGGMDQEQPDRVMGRLCGGTAELLVATDVAARGLDIEQLTHVVNYDVPSAPDSYVHRIGRVGRAGRQGVAITLAEPREHRMLKTIERATKQRIAVEKLPTVADLRARRLELTRAALRESLLGDDLDPFRVVVEPLADESTSWKWRSPRSSWPMRAAEPPLATTRFPRLRWARTASAAGVQPRDGTDEVAGEPRVARRGCSSGSGAPRESGRRTWSAPSLVSLGSAAGTSERSRSPTGSHWWRFPSRQQKR